MCQPCVLVFNSTQYFLLLKYHRMKKMAAALFTLFTNISVADQVNPRFRWLKVCEMIDNLGKECVRGMPKACKNQVIVLFFCWTLLVIGADSQKTHPTEVNALLSIKKSLNNHPKKLHSWNRGDPCASNWTGIICYNDTALGDGYFHVRELSFFNMNLSGSLAPEVGLLSYLKVLDIMWNNIGGTIPKEIGNLTSLELLLLNGNQLTGSLPDELGNLYNLNRIQIDQNQISGPIPKSFANLINGKHFHMNNNSLSGQIPRELSQIPFLVHLLLDNNNLSGPLPPELSEMSNLLILQLDNNNLEGTAIPPSYGNMSRLLKLSLRNCSLKGPIPNWSNMTDIAYIDLSQNQLDGSIPTDELSLNITTMDLSNNNLNGTIPDTFTRLPHLQKLSLANNLLSGSVSSVLWQNRKLNASEGLVLDFEYNTFSDITGSLSIQPNATIRLRGNPVCSTSNLTQFCGSHEGEFSYRLNFTRVHGCDPKCRPPYQSVLATSVARCFCAAPLYIGYRLKSPGFSYFLPYEDQFKEYLSSGLKLEKYQLDIDSAAWQKGPRLRMHLRVFPKYNNDTKISLFNSSEVFWIHEMFSVWGVHETQVFGPYEFLNFTYPSDGSRPGMSKGALAGILLGTIAGSVALTAFVSILIMKRHIQKRYKSSKKRHSSRINIRIDGVKDFSYDEMALATNNFDCTSVVGQGGYGKVYRGTLNDGTVVAIKRALEGSLQGEKEFLTEIELLSRLHHRNLVSLIGYCDEDDEQMLIYEFMSNGTLRDHLSGKSKVPLRFAMRVKTALGAAKGVLYLHTEANPPIFHRDIKASNILLDSKFNSKVADFGLSRLAPVPELEGDVPSHISTVVKGTPGYLDPEYFLTHKLTDKSDVYSLGVVFMELLTGMHPISHGKNIVREVNVAYHSGTIFSVIDERMGSYPSECVEKLINLALKCCQEVRNNRPCMKEVVSELESIWLMMPESDPKTTESVVTDDSVTTVTPSSSSTLRNPCVSQDISGSDLVSNVIPTIAPR
ncbi:probable LRR receptor-like serine/threonine-protein kinase At1g06840 isoform X1 [Primulina huaijiensis]|uniref:probable LRR receptor-like serine/threonine-protein kinase At1g06840 isoform X1 n=3 Tax=Primulina huaijiensis TaxID=1492673 RepID=UPI003CC733AC